MERREIKSMSPGELREWLELTGEKSFRANQIFGWLHDKRVWNFGEMTDLSKSLREKLEQNFAINSPNIKKKLVSAVDGTVKYLYELADGQCVETVLMRYRHGNSLCLSTQVGCRMGCGFCASTIGGLVRNLTPGELLDQVYRTVEDLGERVDSLVLMGIGEPLDNFDHVVRFLELISHPKGYGLSLRHLSLSTCGLVEEIDRLAEYRFPLTLSVSLHAPENKARSRLMPVNRRYPVEELIAACRRYFEGTGRRVSFEYALIEGETDSPEQARALVRRIKGFPCHVNLIPVNPVEERPFRRSGGEAIARFQQVIEKAGIPATVRRELGPDINASCGQLRREAAKHPQSTSQAEETSQ